MSTRHSQTRYNRLLADFMSGPKQEAALTASYEHGRQELAAGHSLLDVIAAQHAALLASDFGKALDAESAHILTAAQEVLMQSVVPFELASRGYAEGNQSLRKVNDTLQQRTAELTQVTDDLVRREQEVGLLNAELERRVIERTAALEAAITELEAFSYSISHDLRAPLRAINGFARILLDEHAANLAPEGQTYLELVRENARKMGCLIDDLLTRLSRQRLRRHRVLPAELVWDVLADLAAEHEGRRVEVLVGELRPCQGDAALLKQLFVNLLSNAFKFTRRQAVGHVEVGSKLANGEVVYFVKDDGAGFDMKYADKLFGVFQRLHRAEEFEGTGVGLAIVQRIVQRHGGRVWAEGGLDRGATFSFTLGGVTDLEPG